jgi:hypothetical protein
MVDVVGVWNSTISGMPSNDIMASTPNIIAVNSIDGGSMLFIIICLFVVIGLLIILTSLQRFTRLLNAIEKWVNSLKYTLMGGGLAAAGYGLYIASQFIVSVGSGINPLWIAEAIGIYIGLTVLGWVLNKVITHTKKLHEQYSALKKLGSAG